MPTDTDDQRAKFEAHEKAQFKIWAESKFKHIAEHMRWVTISIAEEGWMARAAQVPNTDTYEAICEHLAHAIPCYQKPTGCIRESGCEERCQMLLAYQEGYRAALAEQEGGAVQWACERWRAEVANRPLVNTHRRALDTTWRQVVRHFGGDDVALLGPCHDDLVSAQEGTGNG